MVLIEHLTLVGLFTIQRLLQNALTNITENQPLSSEDSSNNNISASVSPSVDSVKRIHNGHSERHEQIIRRLHTETVSAENSIKTTNSSSEECCICLGNYEPGQAICKAITPKCNHCFHQDCLVKWLVDNDTCPLCKVDIMNEKSQPQQAKPRPPRYPFQPRSLAA